MDRELRGRRREPGGIGDLAPCHHQRCAVERPVGWRRCGRRTAGTGCSSRLRRPPALSLGRACAPAGRGRRPRRWARPHRRAAGRPARGRIRCPGSARQDGAPAGGVPAPCHDIEEFAVGRAEEDEEVEEANPAPRRARRGQEGRTPEGGVGRVERERAGRLFDRKPVKEVAASGLAAAIAISGGRPARRNSEQVVRVGDVVADGLVPSTSSGRHLGEDRHYV
ncbi:hypothetical protein RHODGE_RHODGE_03519 [Rhodoplanes serenus]|uniref:Uncharacterized protein n=1 Tax=Rhodoplanes serenus TaxID=200615 RepID=A0A3S4DH84_9BRAD|nr:hypothetical protein RHODGE_RHODGE_03519 [Rhodoplanes serenus]